MRIPGLKTAKLLSRWLRGRVNGGALIVGYHRIASPSKDQYEICVSPTHFAEHLEILRKHAHPFRLSDLVDHLKQGTLPRKSVAVTFDDGYVDNLHNAGQLLEQYQIPATVFISTAYLGEEFWWDELERLVMDAPALPPSLRLKIRAEPFEWVSMPSEEEPGSPAEQSARKGLVKALYFRLLPLEMEACKQVLSELKNMFGSQARRDTTQRALTTDELSELSNSGWVEIGAHSVSHPVLPHLSVAQQQTEIQQCKVFLEELLGKPVLGFAYPHGKFNAQTQAAVKTAGYSFACSSQAGQAWQSQQRYALPRIWPQDWDGERFTRMLRFWLGI